MSTIDQGKFAPEAAERTEALALSPVDLKHLGRYTFGNKALEKEILDLFFQQLPTTISALNAAVSEKDWRVAAHTLKGSGRAVGAWRIAQLAEQAERAPGCPDSSLILETIARIEDAAEEARKFVDSVYG